MVCSKPVRTELKWRRKLDFFLPEAIKLVSNHLMNDVWHQTNTLPSSLVYIQAIDKARSIKRIETLILSC